MTERPIPAAAVTGYRSPMTETATATVPDIFAELNRKVAAPSADRFTVFVTMRAAKSTSVFHWQYNVEELRSAVTGAIGDEHWGDVYVYGPDSDSFSTPGICIQALVTAKEYSDILKVIRQSLWLDLNVNIHRVVG